MNKYKEILCISCTQNFTNFVVPKTMSGKISTHLFNLEITKISYFPDIVGYKMKESYPKEMDTIDIFAIGIIIAIMLYIGIKYVL